MKDLVGFVDLICFRCQKEFFIQVTGATAIDMIKRNRDLIIVNYNGTVIDRQNIDNPSSIHKRHISDDGRWKIICEGFRCCK